jgi:hypothetical protein
LDHRIGCFIIGIRPVRFDLRIDSGGQSIDDLFLRTALYFGFFRIRAFHIQSLVQSFASHVYDVFFLDNHDIDQRLIYADSRYAPVGADLYAVQSPALFYGSHADGLPERKQSHAIGKPVGGISDIRNRFQHGSNIELPEKQ